ncbi:phenylacetyl-CoA ligase [Mycena floridula]|nr:phenylacetyl-CoA ligase [Mycena floridula]
MSIFQSTIPLQTVPLDKTIPQFVLSAQNVDSVLKKRPCIVDEISGREIDLDEIRTRTDSLSRALKNRWNIGEGDVVGLCSPNHVDYAICAWAVHQLGGTVAIMSNGLTVDELVYHLKIAEPKLLFAHQDNIGTVLKAASGVKLSHSNIIILDALPWDRSSLEAVIVEGEFLPAIQEYILKPDEGKHKIAFLAFSSGTTGAPKAVSISHSNVICNVLQLSGALGLTDLVAASKKAQRFSPGDVMSGVLPLYHIYGLCNLHFAIRNRITTVISSKFTFERFLRSISQYRITHLQIVPPMAVYICKHPSAKNLDLSSVKCCIVAAAPLTAELAMQMHEKMPGVAVGQGYGLTESCCALSVFPLTQLVGTAGSAGQLVPGTQAKVVKADGTLAKAGEPGELFAKGGQIALGYWKNEKATKETFTEDGWLRTGDQVTFQPNGDLFIQDRIKEILKVKGLQVAPAELEGHLLNHPDIIDVGVTSVPDEYAGELPFAFVVMENKGTKSVETLKEIIFKNLQHVAESKSQHKWLTGGIEITNEIPKSPSGKILRRVLKERASVLKRKELELRNGSKSKL